MQFERGCGRTSTVQGIPHLGDVAFPLEIFTQNIPVACECEDTPQKKWLEICIPLFPQKF
jgi:hypothetical protein